jgi:hypothetical protein
VPRRSALQPASRELEAGDSFPSSEVYERICEVFGWPSENPLKRFSVSRIGGSVLLGEEVVMRGVAFA